MDEEVEQTDERLFPAIYCRHCGRSGWGVEMSPANNTDLDTSDEDIRRNHASKKGRFRPLLHAGREGDIVLAGETEEAPDNLRWFHVTQRQVRTAAPTGAEARDVSVLPVLTHIGADGDELSAADYCPACQQKDGIRFLGSAIATQLSVTLSTLFGSTNLDPDEKKTLIFADSVQDAAHRAGFVQARSHSLTVRSMLREAVGEEPVSLDLLAERVIAHAGDDQGLRFRILPPDLAEHERFRDFWERRTLAKVPVRVRNRVRQRVAFDAVLEFGLQSRLGRTLELTGSLAAGVQAPAGLMVMAARRAIEDCSAGVLLPAKAGDAGLHAWVRGVLEHMRERGSIEHPWLKKLIDFDGNRYYIWRGRARVEGMPAFPTGRSAPAFPRVGTPPKGAPENVLDQVTTPQSWYTNWTMRCLSVSRAEASALARQLLKRLAEQDVLTATSNRAGAEVYAIPQQSVLVMPTKDDDLRERRNLLVCTICQGEVPGTSAVVDQLDGAPCVVGR